MKKIPHHAKIVLLMLILASALLGVLRFDSFQVGGYQDDAYYIVLAESLASGHGFRLINFPDAPIEVAFPPGWPLLLSPLTFLFPDNLSVLKLLAFLLRLASLFLLYKFFGKRISTPYLEILIALIAFNPFLIGISGMVMSESAYMFFAVLALYLVDKSEENQENSHHWLLAAAVVVAFYAQLIRTVGLSIFLAIIVYLLLRRRFRDFGLVVIIFILGLIPQFWFNAQNGGSLISSGYQGQVFNSSVITKIMQMLMNLQGYLGELVANSIIPIFGPNITAAFSNRGLGFVPQLLNIFILALLALGLFRSAKHFQASEIYVGIYFLSILAFWKPEIGSTQPRFLIPMIPFFYFYVLQAIVWLVGWLPETRTALRLA